MERKNTKLMMDNKQERKLHEVKQLLEQPGTSQSVTKVYFCYVLIHVSILNNHNNLRKSSTPYFFANEHLKFIIEV